MLSEMVDDNIEYLNPESKQNEVVEYLELINEFIKTNLSKVISNDISPNIAESLQAEQEEVKQAAEEPVADFSIIEAEIEEPSKQIQPRKMKKKQKKIMLIEQQQQEFKDCRPFLFARLVSFLLSVSSASVGTGQVANTRTSRVGFASFRPHSNPEDDDETPPKHKQIEAGEVYHALVQAITAQQDIPRTVLLQLLCLSRS